MKLKGKSAIIHGAGSSVGKAIALTLAREGADVLLNDTDADAVKAAGSEVEALGRKAVVTTEDPVARENADKIIKAALDAFGKVDIMVNCPDVSDDSKLVKMEDEQWDKVIDGNVKAVFHMYQAIAATVKAQASGKFVNLTSVAGIAGSAKQTNYSAAKAAIIGFTKTMAKEWNRFSANVNAVAMGVIDTSSKPALGKRQRGQYAAQSVRTATTSEGTPQDVANVVLFLVSDDSNYVTGQTIVVDGGLYV